IRAAVLDRPGVPVRIETLELDPPGPGEIRVRMAAAGVCHSDLHVRDGEWEREGPIVLGHEGSAVVETLGEGVAEAYPGLRPGVLVALAWLIPCGHCRSCRAGRVWSCSESPSYTHRMPDGEPALHRAAGGDVLTYCAIGTFADRQNVPAAAAIPVPDGTPADVAALIGCCVTTGVGAATKTVDVQPGSSVVVIGLGGVGLSCVMGAALAGAGRIVAIDRMAAKLELARAVGATDGLLAGADPTETLAAIRDATGGEPASIGTSGLAPSGGGFVAGGSGSSIGGSSGIPVIRRDPRPWVRKLHAHRTVTTTRFANPMRYTMWIDSQSAQAKNPLWRP